MKIKYNNIQVYEINTENQQKYTEQVFKTNRNKKQITENKKKTMNAFHHVSEIIHAT